MRVEPRIPDAVGIADGVRAGRVRAQDVMTATLEAIGERNPDLNAFVSMAEPAVLLASALEIDRRVEAGEDPGAFAGVPVGVKDLEDVRGLPTSSGSLSSDDEPAVADSRLVARLREAGAIPVGKTNTPEFGYSIDTRNRRFGPTRNPRDLTRSPGGSSGGSAAAVAAEMVPLATGSDGGGSIRIPAAFCGLPGLKPTAGRIADDEEDSWGGLSVLGVLTRSVRDIARFLDVVAQQPRDHPFEASLGQPIELHELRAIASVDLHRATVDHAVAEGYLEAVDGLQAAGLAVERCESPLPSSLETFSVIAAYGDAQRLKGLSQEELSKMSRGYLAWCETGAALTADDLAAANADRGRLVAIVGDLFEHADLILSPTIGVLPWRLEDRSSVNPLDVMLTHPFNLTGHPAISIPLPGLLAGLQAAGAAGSESLLLRFAEAVLGTLGDGKELYG